MVSDGFYRCVKIYDVLVDNSKYLQTTNSHIS